MIGQRDRQTPVYSQGARLIISQGAQLIILLTFFFSFLSLCLVNALMDNVWREVMSTARATI